MIIWGFYVRCLLNLLPCSHVFSSNSLHNHKTPQEQRWLEHIFYFIACSGEMYIYSWSFDHWPLINIEIQVRSIVSCFFYDCRPVNTEHILILLRKQTIYMSLVARYDMNLPSRLATIYKCTVVCYRIDLDIKTMLQNKTEYG